MTRGYPSDWNTRRREVYKRDHYKCQNCGAKGGPRGNYELHAHHIVPKSVEGRHDKSNLITLCKQCHHAVHGRGTARKPRDDRPHLVSVYFGWASVDYKDEHKDDDGYVRLGKSNDSKGFWQRRVDKKRNKRHGGCPNCDTKSLTVSWIGIKPLQSKVKIVECENCKAMYEETSSLSGWTTTYDLREIEKPEDLA